MCEGKPCDSVLHMYVLTARPVIIVRAGLFLRWVSFRERGSCVQVQMHCRTGQSRHSVSNFFFPLIRASADIHLQNER